MTQSEIVLSANRALIFNITCSIRFIFIVNSSHNELQLRIYSEVPLLAKERDLYNSVAGEIAGDFIRNVNVYTEFIVDNRIYNPVNYEGILVYAKKQ